MQTDVHQNDDSQGNQPEIEHADQPSNWFGQIGERFTTDVEIVEFTGFLKVSETEGGQRESVQYRVTMLTDDDCILWAYWPDFLNEVRDRLRISGVVVRHHEYKGQRETLVTDVVVEHGPMDMPTPEGSAMAPAELAAIMADLHWSDRVMARWLLPGEATWKQTNMARRIRRMITGRTPIFAPMATWIRAMRQWIETNPPPKPPIHGTRHEPPPRV